MDDIKVLKQLGKLMKQSAGPGPAAERKPAQRRNLEAFIAGRRSARWHLVAVPAVLAASIAIVVTWMLVDSRQREMRIFLNGEPAEPEAGMVVAAPAGGNLEVAFEGGSMIDLKAGTAGLILKADKNEFRFRIKEGSIATNLDRKENKTWIFQAGPYSIVVLGTSFSITWREEEKFFRIEVSRGRVLVEGPGIGDGKRVLRKGESITIGGEGTSAEDAEQVDTPHLAAPREEGDDSGLPGSDHAGDKRAQELEPAVSLPAWKVLLSQGKYKDAVEAADSLGLDKLAATLNRNELWHLADACRYAHDGPKVVFLLTAFRERFPKSERAKLAAFLLGRVSIELNHDASEAARWFKKYLKEDPHAPLAEEALGGLINASVKSGQREEAEKAAELYLEKYSGGIFSPLARRILEESEQLPARSNP